MAFEIDLKGKISVVIGGARGIGAECVRQLANAGSNVAFAYTKAFDSAKKLEEEGADYGVRIKGYSLDISDEQQVKELFVEIEKDFGSVDIFVFNAAILIASPFIEMTSDVWRRTMAVNVDGAFFSAQAALKIMLKKAPEK